jgi:hypothetical protein
MRPEWKLSDGRRFPEDGFLPHMADIQQALSEAKATGTRLQVDLVDADQEDRILVRGFQMAAALKGGWVKSRQEREARRRARPADATAAASTEGPPTNLQGVVQGWRIPLGAFVWGVFALARVRIGRPETGERYPFTPEGMAWFLADLTGDWFRRRLLAIVGISAREASRPEVAARLERLTDAILHLRAEDVDALATQAQGEEDSHGGEGAAS